MIKQEKLQMTQIEHLVSAVAKLLTERGKTISTAESCTGGLLSGYLTSISGSSTYFWGGIVCYHNSIKEKILGVSGNLLAEHGAVSREVALAMAKQVKKQFKTDLGIGITGIAGPTGGTSEKPVGLVYLALSYEGKEVCRKFHFHGDRSHIRLSACLEALKFIIEGSGL